MHGLLPDFVAPCRCIQAQMIPARMAIRPLHSTEITRSLHSRFDRRSPRPIRRPGGCEADTRRPSERGMRWISCSKLLCKAKVKYERRLKRKRFDRNGQGSGGAAEPIPK